MSRVNKIDGYRIRIVGLSLAGLILLTGCSKDEGDKPIELVKAQFSFSLPLKGTRVKGHTRMDESVVQVENTPFRGIDDMRLLCYNTSSSMPSATDGKIGDIIEIKTSDTDITPEDVDYSQCQEIRVPLNTDHFGFYASATVNESMATHDAKMRYGIVETVGLSKGTYIDNSSIRFRPVPICTSDEPLGGSVKGQALLTLLNELISITVSGVDAPNDKWSTVNSIYLNEAYQRMTQLTTLSSFNVQTMLTTIYRTAQIVLDADEEKVPDSQGSELAQAIVNKIDAHSYITFLDEGAVVELQEAYQGFPMDLGLPAGAARIKWDADLGQYVADQQAYGKDLNVLSMNDYAYPMNLQYQICSDILASDQLVIQPDPVNQPDTYNEYENWNKVVDAYNSQNADTEVKSSTQSVIMKKQVEYAVGRMAIRSRIHPTDQLTDANGQTVVPPDVGYTLKGYIIGGQTEVGYNYAPLNETGLKEYAVYDSYLDGSEQKVKRSLFDYAPVDYILGLGTKSNKKINIAMELVNDGDAFQGADGVIAHGATFYLVAELDPSQHSNVTDQNQIFNRDYATKVDLTISATGLATATYGMPNLDVPHPTVGLSVDLIWEEGLFYDNVILARYTDINN